MCSSAGRRRQGGSDPILLLSHPSSSFLVQDSIDPGSADQGTRPYLLRNRRTRKIENPSSSFSPLRLSESKGPEKEFTELEDSVADRRKSDSGSKRNPRNLRRTRRFTRRNPPPSFTFEEDEKSGMEGEVVEDEDEVTPHHFPTEAKTRNRRSRKQQSNRRLTEIFADIPSPIVSTNKVGEKTVNAGGEVSNDISSPTLNNERQVVRKRGKRLKDRRITAIFDDIPSPHGESERRYLFSQDRTILSPAPQSRKSWIPDLIDDESITTDFHPNVESTRLIQKTPLTESRRVLRRTTILKTFEHGTQVTPTVTSDKSRRLNDSRLTVNTSVQVTPGLLNRLEDSPEPPADHEEHEEPTKESTEEVVVTQREMTQDKEVKSRKPSNTRSRTRKKSMESFDVVSPKDVIEIFQSFASFDLTKGGKKAVVQASRDFIQDFLKRLTDSLDWDQTTPNLCNVKKVLRDLEYIPRHDPGNRTLYQRIREVSDYRTQVRLIPMAIWNGKGVNNTTLPRNVWDERQEDSEDEIHCPYAKPRKRRRKRKQEQGNHSVSNKL